MEEILKIAASLGGVTGFFAAVLFVVYRIDHKSSEERLDKLLTAYNETVERNTKALTELVTLVQRLNGH